VRVSGFTFVRNGVELGYPFVPSIRSLLPLCDEIIVNVPRSTDETMAHVTAISDARIRVIETEWNGSPQECGLELSHHTNLALRECTGDWCVYIQADEVLHEATLPAMRAAMERALTAPGVEGLVVDYTHLYGSYHTEAYGPGWYDQEVRVVRRASDVRSVGDAQGFRRPDGGKLRVRRSGGRYFHYGHALRPDLAARKARSLSSLYHDAEAVDERMGRLPVGFYEEDQRARTFTASHPHLMQEIVAQADWRYVPRAPLVRFRRKRFWRDVSYLVKQLTGLGIGIHRNFRLVR
jgi:hypothetical protein